MNKILITFMLIVLSLGQIKAQLTELVAKNEKAIFQIFAYDEYGTPTSTGTGFFTSQSGIALTNLHVLEDAKFAFVRDNKGGIFQIDKITRVSTTCDIAEFQVVAKNGSFPILNLINEIPLKGSDIFVIGNPEGFESTVSTGIISSVREQENNKVIQISAPISPGSSGSPIMDMKGNVIGIATYQYKKGQNLNFGYSSGCTKNLIANTKYNLSNNGTGNLFVINKIFSGENDLVLNSIEVNEKNTVVNLSYTNTSLTYGDYAFIFTVIGDKNQSFYLESVESGKKFYLYDASIGNSPQAPTYLKLGETKKFKLYFPSIGDIKKINIKEGMQGSDWSFSNINLADFKNLNFEDNNFFNDFHFQTGLKLLSEKDFAPAYIILKNYVEKNENNDYALNLVGIISYILDNNLDAFLFIKKAIKINPTNDTYYFNLYYLNKKAGNINEALKNISTSIQLNDDNPEYYNFRGELYMEQKEWKKAIEDFNKFANSDRVIGSQLYFQRAICKLWLQDKTGCGDFEKAYNISKNKKEQDAIKEFYNKYCK